MSVSLLIERPPATTVDAAGERNTRQLPVSVENVFRAYWEPVIERGNYTWLPEFAAVGLALDAENFAPTLAELRDLATAFRRQYAPDHPEFEYLTGRLANLIAYLEGVNPADLESGELKLFLG